MDRIELENLAASDAGQQAAEEYINEPDIRGARKCDWPQRYDFSPPDRYCKYCHGERVVGTEFVVGMGPCDAPCPVCGEE